MKTNIVSTTIIAAKDYTAANALLKSTENVVLLRPRAASATKKGCVRTTAARGRGMSEEDVLNNMLPC